MIVRVISCGLFSIYDLKDRRGYSHLKEEALDRTMCRNRLEETLDLSSDRILNE